MAAASEGVCVASFCKTLPDFRSVLTGLTCLAPRQGYPFGVPEPEQEEAPIVREDIPWLRRKEVGTGGAAGRSLPWRSFQLQMRPRSVVVPEGLAIIVCSHPLVVQKDSCFVKMTMLDYANITIEQSQETTRKTKQENPSWRETFEFGTTVNFRPAGIVPKTDWSLYPASN